MVNEMITVTDKPLKEMDSLEIRHEIIVQGKLLKAMRYYLRVATYKFEQGCIDQEEYDRRYWETENKWLGGEIDDKERMTQHRVLNIATARSFRRENHMILYEKYVNTLEAFLEELKYLQDRAKPPKENLIGSQAYQKREQRRKRNKAKQEDNSDIATFTKSVERDGISLQWSKDILLLVARDRGYLTEAAVVSAIEGELGLSRARAMRVLETGKLTWGQVLCLGALFEMTPKEFCDVFMNGYFQESFGQLIASYDNIDKEALLKRAIKPQSM